MPISLTDYGRRQPDNTEIYPCRVFQHPFPLPDDCLETACVAFLHMWPVLDSGFRQHFSLSGSLRHPEVVNIVWLSV